VDIPVSKPRGRKKTLNQLEPVRHHKGRQNASHGGQPQDSETLILRKRSSDVNEAPVWGPVAPLGCGKWQDRAMLKGEIPANDPGKLEQRAAKKKSAPERTP
jgi:hypothetical protein